MSQQLSVFIPCLPPKTTAQQKGAFATKSGGVRFFKKRKTRLAEQTLWALLQPHAPAKPFDGPLCLVIRITYPWRAAEKKTRIRGHSLYPIETRPDIDNLYKMIGDVMTTLRFWNDDGQISSLSIKKTYGDLPGIHINLTADTATDRDGAIVSCQPTNE